MIRHGVLSKDYNIWNECILELITNEGFLSLFLYLIVSHKEIVNVKCLYALSFLSNCYRRRPLIVNQWQVPAV